jgi:hypothetical protein
MSTRTDLGLVLLTCMELPIDDLLRRLSHHATPLGVLANAGGLVTAEALGSLAQLRRGDQRLKVAVVHHADCAAATSPATRGVSRGAEAAVWSTLAADAAATVGRALRELVDSGVLRPGDVVVGLVCDIDAHQLSMVGSAGG